MNEETGETQASDADDAREGEKAHETGQVENTEEAKVAALGRVLAERVVLAFPGWIVATGIERFGSCFGEADAGALERVAAQAGAELRAPLFAFFALDIDAQRTTPLSIVRSVMPMVSEALRDIGVAPVARDPFDEQANPDDVYALGPYAWSEFGEAVHVAGLQWGAAKAFVHRKRHRRA